MISDSLIKDILTIIGLLIAITFLIMRSFTLANTMLIISLIVNNFKYEK